MNRPENQGDYIKPRGWISKFACAFRGILLAVRGQSSFPIYCLFTLVVVIAGFRLEVSRIEWAVLVICIGMVFAAEIFNGVIEALAPEIDRKENPQIGRALDMAAGAVLVTAITAAIAGVIIFSGHCVVNFQW